MGCKVRSEICETALVEGDCISLGKTRWRPGQVWGQIRRRMLRVSAVSDALWPHGCSPPGSSVHGIPQARGLEWVTIPFSRGSSPPRDRAQVSGIAGGFCAAWGTMASGQEGLLVDSRGAVLCGWGPDFPQGGLLALGFPHSLLCRDLPYAPLHCNAVRCLSAFFPRCELFKKRDLLYFFKVNFLSP